MYTLVTNFKLKLGITSPVCSEGNIVTSKLGAGVILKALLNLGNLLSYLLRGTLLFVETRTHFLDDLIWVFTEPEDVVPDNLLDIIGPH